MSLFDDVKFLFVKIFTIVIVFAFVFKFVFGICAIRDLDMKPSIKNGDLVIYYRLDRQYVQNDCVVVEYEGKTEVRRVVAVAGDEVDITEDGLVINGSPQQELEIFEDTRRYEGGIEFPIRLNDGEIFVLGDARLYATDSRVYGSVKIEETKGKVMLVVRKRGI